MKGKNADEMQQMMLTRPVGPLILKLAIPTIIAMLVTSIYSLADTFFVARLGVIESSAVGIVFSIMTLIQATGLLFGQGSANTISPLLGQGRREEADQVFTVAFFTALAFMVLFGLCSLIFIEPIMRFIGATDETLSSCIAYGSIIVVGAPWLGVCYTMNNIFRSEGKAVLGMTGMGTGALLNIALDALFIMVFHWGVRGAALATVLSQLVSFIILLTFFLTKRSNMKLSLRYLKPRWWIYKSIFSLGTPSLLRNLGATVCNITLMHIAAPYAATATAAFSIVGRVAHFYQSVCIGIGQGMQPVVGYNWGAGKRDRVKSGFNFTLAVATVMFTLLALFSAFGSRALMRFFISDSDSILIGGYTLLFQAIPMPLMAYVILGGMLMQCTRHARKASILALIRQGVVFIPVILILSSLLGLLGLELAQAVSDTICFILTLIIIRSVRRREGF